MIERARKILIVDDEPEIRRFLRASFNCITMKSARLKPARKHSTRLIRRNPILSFWIWDYPISTAWKSTRQIREISTVPIIILSVRNGENDKIEALDAGADDYLTKPSAWVNFWRASAFVLRRNEPQISKTLMKSGDLELDIPRHRVTLAGEEIALTPTEFDILAVLMQNQGVVVTHRQLIHQVWGSVYEDESRLLRVNISNLRHKLESDPNRPIYIITELGVGYRFRDSDAE